MTRVRTVSLSLMAQTYPLPVTSLLPMLYQKKKAPCERGNVRTHIGEETLDKIELGIGIQ